MLYMFGCVFFQCFHFILSFCELEGARTSNTRPYTYRNVCVKCLVKRIDGRKVRV